MSDEKKPRVIDGEDGPQYDEYAHEQRWPTLEEMRGKTPEQVRDVLARLEEWKVD